MSIEVRRVRVCSVDDVPAGEGRVVRIGDRPIAVFRTAETFHALDNTCTHMGGPLADGLVADETVACPLHERRFRLATGQAVGHDCGAVAAYPIEVQSGGVYITIPVVSRPDADGLTVGTFSGDEVAVASDDAGPNDAAEAEHGLEAETRG